MYESKGTSHARNLFLELTLCLLNFKRQIEMCRKVKDINKEEINRLKEKYADILQGKYELNIHKISNFVNLVIPVLAEQFKDQTDVRYFCLFSNCIPQKRSYKTKQKYVQHLCLKHGFQLPGQGLFLLNNDKNIKYGGFVCKKCKKNFKRKDHLEAHIKNVECSKSSKKKQDSKIKDNKADLRKDFLSVSNKYQKKDDDILILEKSFSNCSLVDISLEQPSIICLDE
ncbi:unnamed protein product [Brachionus calyciflorus]|uniref:C2H2-type domain-containing protein n=1 Tax=Brachionus calyciflorus TaxID=104777 RepID=A0A814H351_9BILA|nr:unnamed protein product [Brachionus calyciflorus]